MTTTAPPPSTPRRDAVGAGPSRTGSLLLAVAAGVALWSAFPDVAAWPMALVAVGLLHAALGRSRGRAAGWNALVGFVAAMTFWLPHIWWASIATDIVPWIALATLQSVFWALLGAAWTWARRTPLLSPREGRPRATPTAAGRALATATAFAVVFVGVEELRATVPFGGFPWGRLAWSMVDAPLGRAAWLGSTTLVSLLVAFVGVLLALLLAAVRSVVRSHRRGDRPWRTPLTLAVTASAVALAPMLLPLPTGAGSDPLPPGVVDAGVATHEAPGSPLLAGAVQGNVADPSRGAAANLAEVLANHLDGTYRLAERDVDLDVVLWPENGSDADPQAVAAVGQAIDDAAQAVGAPLLVGSQEFPETGGRYNVSLLWEPGTGVTDRYAKQRPAPFGEYIPLRSVVQVLSAQVDRVRTDMLAGDEPAYVDVPHQGSSARLATIICFEVAYDSLVRDAVARGAQVLVVPTNNASFGFSAESTQQLAMTRMQAMITGRAAVQISTVGVSGVVMPDGTLVASTELFTADELVAALPLRTTLTPAVRAGSWPAGVVGVLAAGLVAWGIAGTVRVGPTRRSAV